MTRLVIEQVPTELLERLKQEAAREHRDLNEQILVLLEEALVAARPTGATDDERTLRSARDEQEYRRRFQASIDAGLADIEAGRVVDTPTLLARLEEAREARAAARR